jgi:hypothetical protein
MAINRELILQAIESLSSIGGANLNPSSLVEDTMLLAYAFPADDDFKAAVFNTKRALEGLVKGSYCTSELKYNLHSWNSYHYQHRVKQGQKSDCRIIFRIESDGHITVKGFGHRFIPTDIYYRLSEQRHKRDRGD